MSSEPLRRADRNYVLQQGLPLPEADPRGALMSALMFQPRAVALLFAAGWLLQSGPLILALAAALFWGALVPTHNPFDLVYGLLPGRRAERVRLGPAPAPRRFAQGMAGTMATVVGTGLLAGAREIAVPVAVVFAAAVTLLVAGRFCLGSFVYHLLRGRVVFAFRTLPWVRTGVPAGGGCSI